jgi:uncharacterized membrane protein YpjA
MKLNNLAKSILAINLIGMLYGFYYYIPKLQQTGPALWPLVPDSPVSILFFILVFIGVWRGEFASFFASAWLIKYGLWTVFVMLFHSKYYMSPEYFAGSWLLYIIPHIFMAVEAVLIMKPKIQPLHAIAVLAIFLVNDFSDYIIGTRPLIPEENLNIVAASAVFLSLFAFGFLFFFSKAALESRLADDVRKSAGVR